MSGSLPMVDRLNAPVINNPGVSFSDNLAAAYQHYYLNRDTFPVRRSLREFFYEKAQRALQGEIVNPVIVTDSITPDAKRQALIADRELLTMQLGHDHRPGDIPILAQAQAAFDCQVLLAVSGIDGKPYETCHRRFENLVSRLEKPLWPQLEYHVFFESNRSVLERDAIDTLKNIAQLKRKDKFATLIIAGNTDSRGSVEANYRLAVQRARAVRNILLQFGVRENEIMLLEERDNYPAFFALNSDASAEKQRRVSILVERNLVK